MANELRWELEEADADCRRTFKCTTCREEQHIDLLEDYEQAICRDCCDTYQARMTRYWNNPMGRMH